MCCVADLCEGSTSRSAHWLLLSTNGLFFLPMGFHYLPMGFFFYHVYPVFPYLLPISNSPFFVLPVQKVLPLLKQHFRSVSIPQVDPLVPGEVLGCTAPAVTDIDAIV